MFLQPAKRTSRYKRPTDINSDAFGEALSTIKATISLLWFTGDEVLRAIRNTPNFHTSNKGALLEFFTPIIGYLGEVSALCDEPDNKALKEASDAFMIALRGNTADPTYNNNAVKAGYYFRQVSCCIVASAEERNRDLFNKINATVVQPDLRWLGIGMLVVHKEAFARHVVPTKKNRTKFARKCKRMGLGAPHKKSPFACFRQKLTCN